MIDHDHQFYRPDQPGDNCWDGSRDYTDSGKILTRKKKIAPHSSAPTEQEIRDKLLEELFVWVDSEQTISITADKIIKKILSLRTPTPEAQR